MQQSLPQTGFLRLPQIIGDPKAVPPIPPLIPVSRGTWLKGVKEGRYPRPYRLGPNTVGWKVEEILRMIETVEAA